MKADRTRQGWSVFLAFLCGLPLLLLALLSVSRTWRYPNILPDDWAHNTWTGTIWGGGGLGESLLISMVIAVVVAALATAGGFVTGRFMAYGRNSNRLLFVAYLPYAISPVIFAIPLMYLFFVTDLAGTVAGVIIAHSILAYAFSTIFFTAFWTPRMKAFEELAQSLGADPAQMWLHVLVPLAQRAIALCFFQAFLISWFQYGLTLLLGTGRIQTLTIRLYSYVGEANIHLAAASGLLLATVPLALLLARRRTLFRRFMT